MNPLQLEWEIKLKLMNAITRSQEALARMLESTADVSGATGVPPEILHEHVRVLTGMQGALLRLVSGQSWRPPVKGEPGAPWLSGEVTRIKR
ncbi:hypothetical protein [Cohnella soli]|uniref:Aspartyl-phosphate phosphatase Spo0E family protein n=1 Tax=Cohnella soli TaxID=425005 RepID=A0ABW0HX25_9BACL